ncbi:MAG TPA: hypothetical protein VFF89_13200 [Sphingobium sp.]|nr:hypothetical protein [Sphingobium sp.]
MQLAAALACVALLLPAPVLAQRNDNDFTPLGSRIKRDRQFPLSLPTRFSRDQTNAVNRARSKTMMHQFSNCVYKRSKDDALDLLDKTDFGFVAFEQIKLSTDRALKIYGFSDCLSRVASANNSGVALRFNASALRQWLVQEAYFDHYADGPGWVKPGNVVKARSYVLSAENPAVHGAMDFADCTVAADPYSADFFFRTPAGAADEKKALQGLMPVLGPCLPAGQQIEVTPQTLRIWLGEALWYAARNSAPADPDFSEVAP